MNNSYLLLAAPELWVLTMACVILVVDLFLREERRGIIHLLALITLRQSLIIFKFCCQPEIFLIECGALINLGGQFVLRRRRGGRRLRRNLF